MNNITLPTTKALDLGALHAELARVLPHLAGIGIGRDTVEIRSTLPLTAAELTTIQTVLAAHDAAAVALARRAKEQRRRDELAKDPKKLTLPERITRLEILQGVD